MLAVSLLLRVIPTVNGRYAFLWGFFFPFISLITVLHSIMLMLFKSIAYYICYVIRKQSL